MCLMMKAKSIKVSLFFKPLQRVLVFDFEVAPLVAEMSNYTKTLYLFLMKLV